MLTLACVLCTIPEAFKILDAQALINRTFASQCFQTTLAQIVGNEDMRHVVSANKDYQIKFYYEQSNVIGYVNGTQPIIYLNRFIHSGYNVCKSASNIAHEISHTQGFSHFFDVPYSVNYAFEACNAECQTLYPLGL